MNRADGEGVAAHPAHPAQSSRQAPPPVVDAERFVERRSAPQRGESSMAEREKLLLAREQLTRAREGTADQRDVVAQVREQAIHLRETATSARERNAFETDGIKATLESHILKLRQANQHLVISTIEAQAMTEQVQTAKDLMGYMAHHDVLTDLPNRILLMERLTLAIGQAQRREKKLAVLFLDLDRFKIINDSLGHAIGDEVLRAVAERLSDSIRATDTASRQGGDEFVVLLSEVADEKAVCDVTDKMCKAISASYSLAEQDVYIGVTIGISMYPDDGQDAATLIKNADLAMYHGKNSGRDRYLFYRREMNDRAVERQRTEGDLHRALKRGEFVLHYQPKVELASGAISGAEALIRWNHPTWGLTLPGRFIPIAEECGLIVPVGRWVLREACLQAVRWRDAGLEPGTIAVNISALEFRRPDFVGYVGSVLADAGLAPRALELEITEGVLMSDAPASVVILLQLKAMGVLLAVDDFGTGYSSLSYLKRFPIDVLKIDQSFVHDICAPDDRGIIVSAVIAMGTSLGQRVIAEGVENQLQLDYLKEQHCAEVQGNYFSKPLPPDELALLLAADRIIVPGSGLAH